MDTHLRTKIISYLNILELGAAAVMATAFPFSFAAFNVGIVILIISFFLKRILNKDISPFDPFIDTCMVLFYIIAIASFFHSTYPVMTLQGAHKLGRYLLLFIATREIIGTSSNLKRLVFALCLGGFITSLDGILQLVLGADPLRGQTVSLGFNDLIRLSASFPNPNALSIYLSSVLPLAFCLARYGKLEKKISFAAWALVLMMLFCSFYTYARPAVLALFLNMVGFCIVKKDKKIPLLFLGVGIVGVIFLQGEVKTWVVHLHSVGDFFVDQTRFFHHHAALNMIAAKPWTGVGLNAFDINYGTYRLAGDPFTRWSAHQGYLQLAAETGIPGLTAFLAMLLAIAVYCWKRYPRAAEPWIQAAFLGIAGGLISFLVSGFFESLFWQPRQANFFWFWTGLLCAAARFTAQKLSSVNDVKTVKGK